MPIIAVKFKIAFGNLII